MRAMALQAVPYYDSLMARGFFSLILAVWFGRRQRLSLFPKSPKTQALRALLAGLALAFFTISYNWLTASAVSVLSNVDVPLLLILGPTIGVKSSISTRSLAFLSICFLIYYVSGLEAHPDLYKGLATLGIGSLLLCFGYLFIKKSMEDENEAITIIVPSVAILFYGLLIRFANHDLHFAWDSRFAIEAILSGASMFTAYYSTMRLYSLTDLASAEFPTLLSSIAIQPLESLILDVPIRLSYLVSSVGFVAAIYFILCRKEVSSS